jgi:hypothetical protein
MTIIVVIKRIYTLYVPVLKYNTIYFIKYNTIYFIKYNIIYYILFYNINNMNIELNKYLKYKNKYLNLKKKNEKQMQTGGTIEDDFKEGEAVKYVGILYKNIDGVCSKVIAEFVGVVEGYKFVNNEGYIGLFLRPEYISLSGLDSDFKKIKNYTPPTSKYFYYPHFVGLKEKINYYEASSRKLIFTLDSATKVNLVDYSKYTTPFLLDDITQCLSISQLEIS